ncbi:hypothetical protein [Calycomorphotria hydatis]|uniref:Uncharacterized protein n=1 Tax=Calycomorphotria hydatis TaxID=2528027 RepID=A0A517TBW1_9PLAN|nr:hypothetical protein [Calycomorphotria hydatis]QDT65854.1 hypothetical protein V22_31160 [Calycomorphotria hydatis]
MMFVFRKLFGLCGLLLGLVGVLLFAAVIAGILSMQSMAANALEQIQTATDDGIAKLSTGVKGTAATLKTTRTSIQNARLLKAFAANGNNVALEDKIVIDRIAAELGAYIDRFHEWQSIADVARQTAERLVEISDQLLPYLSQQPEEKKLGETLKAVADTLSDLKTTLTDAQQQLHDISVGDDPKTALERLTARLDHLDQLLGRLSSSLGITSEALETYRTELITAIESLRHKLIAILIVIIFLLLWMLIAQWCLLTTGWRWLLLKPAQNLPKEDQEPTNDA